MKSNKYRGWRGRKGPRASVNGARLTARHVISGIKQRGFNWGFKGGGSMQLAFAILSFEFGDGIARQFHQAFRNDVIANLEDQWSITSYYLNEWLIKAKNARDARYYAPEPKGGPS